MIATTPKPPYYAVIFTSERTESDNGYSEMAKKMEDLAKLHNKEALVWWRSSVANITVKNEMDFKFDI